MRVYRKQAGGCYSPQPLGHSLAIESSVFGYGFTVKWNCFQTIHTCPRPNCSDTLDAYGDHMRFYSRGPLRIARREAQVELLAGDLKNASKHLVVELRPPMYAPRTTRHTA